MKHLANALLIVASFALSLGIGELAVRMIDGYAPGSAKLIFVRKAPAESGAAAPAIALAGGVEAIWFSADPPPLGNRTPPDAEVAATRRFFPGNSHWAYSEWSLAYLREQLCRKPEFFGDAAEVFAFDPPPGVAAPRFRLLRSLTVPEGMTLNNYGWRGENLGICAPEKTLRIAFIGASTTIGNHQYAWSYPEYIGAWLNRWAEATAFPYRFEIMNTGRYGAKLEDMTGIVEMELLPVRPDLFVYYEGYNDFAVPYHSCPQQAPQGEADFTAPPKLAQYSAIFRRIMNLEQLTGEGQLGEIAKPDCVFRFPETVDAKQPDPDSGELPPNMRAIVRQLDKIHAAADRIGGKMIVSSFLWMVEDGMVLDASRHQQLYRHLNNAFPNVTYRDLRRAADFHNTFLHAYALKRGIDFIDPAAVFPYSPDYFSDAIHLNEHGTKVQAWVMLQQLIPLIEAKVKAGLAPSGLCAYPSHPYLEDATRRSVSVDDILAGCQPQR